MKPQRQLFEEQRRLLADKNKAFMELVNHPTNPLTREDLARLIERNPQRYMWAAGFLKTLPTGESR